MNNNRVTDGSTIDLKKFSRILFLFSFSNNPILVIYSFISGFNKQTNSENFMGRKILSKVSSSSPPLLPGNLSVDLLKSIECDPVNTREQLTNKPLLASASITFSHFLTEQISSMKIYFLSFLLNILLSRNILTSS